MSRIVGLLILALVAFYVGWPAYSGYRIKTALDAGDTAGLSQKIDFDRVRASLRPAVTAEVEKSLKTAVEASGQPPAVMDKLKADTLPKLVDVALNGLVTPEAVVRIYRERADLKTAVAKVVAERMASPEGLVLLGSIAGSLPTDKATMGNVLGQLGKLAEKSGVDPGKVLGSLFGKKPAEEPAAGAAQAGGAKSDGGFGIDNVKSVAMSGPAGYAIGIAKNKLALKPEAIIEVAFTGGDWKLVGITPQI